MKKFILKKAIAWTPKWVKDRWPVIKKWLIVLTILKFAMVVFYGGSAMYFAMSNKYYQNKIFKRISRGELDCSQAYLFMRDKK